MRIELDSLEKRETPFAHTYEPGELLLDDEHARLIAAPEVTGRVVRDGHHVRLLGRITARAEIDCDRCLKSVSVPVETEFDVEYVPAADYLESEAAELQAEDMSLSVFREGAIDVDELVREQVLLALPARIVCGEDCKGLCPVCGADRNTQTCECESRETDPRWDALKDLRF